MAVDEGASQALSLKDTRQRYEALLLQRWRDNDDGSHDIAHIRRVWGNATTIADSEDGPVDRPVLLAATIFHDLVNLPKNAPDRHLASAQSAQHALDLLRDDAFSDAQRDNIAHCITAHSFSAGVKAATIEAKILQDADRLDALGAVGLARVFYIAGQLKTSLYNPDDPKAENRPLDDRQFCLDHFDTKLFKLQDMMNTETGKRMAKTRTDDMRAFRDTLWAEIEHQDMPK
jgi:uncharacterized protein